MKQADLWVSLKFWWLWYIRIRQGCVGQDASGKPGCVGQDASAGKQGCVKTTVAQERSFACCKQSS